MRITSQSINYRSSLPDGSRVSFGITAPITRRPHLHLQKAHRAQNITIDSHRVALEVQQQHRIRYAAVDSGGSSHFYPIDYTGEQHDLTADPIRAGCANKAVMISLAEDIIHFNKLPLAAKKCHKFKEIWLPLLSVPQL